MNRTFALTWNPELFDWEKNGLRDELQTFQTQGHVDSNWSCGWSGAVKENGPRPGDRFFLFRVGADKPGLIAAGTFLHRPTRRGQKWRGAPRAKIRFDYIADFRLKDQFLSREALILLANHKLHFQASGMPIPPAPAARLEILLALLRTAIG